MDDVLVLIGSELQANDLLEQVEADGARSEVFGRVESVTRAEWFDGGREGMKPALVFITPSVNYSGEPEAELHGVRYWNKTHAQPGWDWIPPGRPCGSSTRCRVKRTAV